MYNKIRGTDGCGYYYNGYINKGIGNERDWSEFITKNQLLPGHLDTEMFLGHVRKSSTTAHTYNNTHPFDIDDLIITHNGTIDNMDALLRKHDIRQHTTVDTQGLGLLINKIGFEKALREYVGYAALAMTRANEPESLYLFMGAAKRVKTDTLVYFERPVFTLEQPEGIYYSSMISSLKAISSDGTEPKYLIHNNVVEIRNGEFTGNNEYIFRDDSNLKPDPPEIDPTKVHKVSAIVKPPSVPRYRSSEGENPRRIPHSSILTDENLDDMIRQDVSAFEQYSLTGVYVKHGRYYCNKKLLEGEFKIDQDGMIHQTGAPTYYFVKGIMMKSAADYKKALEMRLPNSVNVAQMLSPFSNHPVFCLESEATNLSPKHKNKWYAGGSIVYYSRTFFPALSNKKYSIDAGKTIAIDSGK